MIKTEIKMSTKKIQTSPTRVSRIPVEQVNK